ncbi:MAG: DMT family transporter [Verrucomicrobiales bacterium]|nr:DMT family transporter [Verrucomicrobiales bacterium]
MRGGKSNSLIAAELLLTVLLWSGNNVALKYQLRYWPPVFTASTRFLCAGFLLLALLHWTDWLGRPTVLSAEQRRKLWTHGALSLAIYIVVFMWAVAFASPATVALFMGTSPVWALVWEERFSRHNAHRYFAAALALAGVLVLFLPSLNLHSAEWTGHLLALAASILWTHFSRQCRTFGAVMSGLELTGQTFWRAGVLLIPVALAEVAIRRVSWNGLTMILHVYSILFSGLIAFALWHNALRVWPTSRAFLFGNLVPVATMALAHIFLGDPVTTNLWIALGLILAAVFVGQADWRRIISSRWSPGE